MRPPFYCEYELITLVGAGAVVTGDLPDGVVAAGVPACVLRGIGDQDRAQSLPR